MAGGQTPGHVRSRHSGQYGGVRPVLVSLLAAVLVVPGASAHGGGIIKAALDGLRSGDPVYVAPTAIPTLETAEAIELRERIAAAPEPIYVAVLPADAQHELGTADKVLQAIVEGIGLDGTYAVVVGGQFRATSTDRGARNAELERRSAERTSHEGPAAGLTAFVDGLSAEEDGDGPGASRAFALLIPVFALLALLATLVRARRRSSVG
jgi:hypothetical protein